MQELILFVTEASNVGVVVSDQNENDYWCKILDQDVGVWSYSKKYVERNRIKHFATVCTECGEFYIGAPYTVLCQICHIDLAAELGIIEWLIENNI